MVDRSDWQTLVVDDHTQRVVAPVLAALNRLQTGDASIAELQASVVGAAGGLDNAPAAMRFALEGLESDLETIRFAVRDLDQVSAVQATAAEFLEMIGDT